MTNRHTPIPPSSPDAAAAPDRLADARKAQIERTLKPYVGKVPAAMLARMRENLEEALTTHPVAIALLNSLHDTERERKPVERSGPRLRDGIEVDDDDDAAGGSGAS